MQRDWEAAGPGGTARKLTQPLGTAVLVFLILTAAFYALVPVLLAGSSNFTVFGFGYGPVCGDVPLNGLTVGGSSNILAHMRPGTSSSGSGLTLCVNEPTMGQRVLTTLTQVPTAFFYVAILLLLWQLLRAVRRTGPFAGPIAQRLRFLAWFILAGSLAVAVGQSVARSIFTSTVVTDQVPVLSNAINATTSGFSTPLLVACGLLTLARVIRVGARMNDDLAGTV